MPDETTLGALASALAKAQAAFPTITRDKEVTVQTKSGGSYKFKYAPLDKILSDVRKPLSDNGLSILQLLDEDTLVTSLLHSSGALISGRTPIPQTEGIQAYGSAITYLRRYAIQALLGIAAEEDDDGNRAAGNQASFGGRPAPEHLPPRDGSLIGTAAIAAAPHDYELRLNPEGYSIGFKLVEGRQNIRVIASGALAEDLSLVKDKILGARVQCFGRMSQETWEMDKGTPKARSVPYTRLILSRIEAPTITLPESDDGALARPDAAGRAPTGADRNPSAPDETELDAVLDSA